MREQVYRDPRPAECFARFHERARTREPDAVYTAVRVFASLLAWTVYRTRAISVRNVPAAGPVIIAANHFSNADHFFFGSFLRRRVRFMAKSQMFTGPMAHVYAHGGVFPVRRGQRDEEAFVTARTILANGGCLAIYPEGGRSRTGRLAEHARPGVGRLALETGASVVPVAVHGSDRVREWKRLRFPRVTVRFGRPMRWEPVQQPTREQQQAVADEILRAIRSLYEELDTLGRREVARRERVRRRECRRR